MDNMLIRVGIETVKQAIEADNDKVLPSVLCWC